VEGEVVRAGAEGELTVRLTSPLYWSPFLYRWTMNRLYGDLLAQRYQLVSDLIAEGSRVVELCCGAGDLYDPHLRRKGVDYQGFDLLPGMVASACRRGARAEHADVAAMAVPPADHVVMIGSLYHFHPHESAIVARMAGAAARSAIILEPIVNLSQSANPVVRLLARAASFIGGVSSGYRLDAGRLERVLAEARVTVTASADVLHGKYRLVVVERGRPA
jgi:hypothetical protein